MADGDSLVLGNTNDCTQPTAVSGSDFLFFKTSATSVTSTALYGESAVVGVAGEGARAGVVGNVRLGRGDPWAAGVWGSGVQDGVMGVYGDSNAAVGVRGDSLTDAGVFGTSATAPGVSGFSSRGFGLYGYSQGGTALWAVTGNRRALAGGFWGDVWVYGDLLVSGAKSAAVADTDGSYRRLYSLESPESMFEDFGQAKLRRGKVSVKLDRIFARLVRPGRYYVFVTPEGECNGLYVRRKTATGFEVAEQGRGRSSVRFSYRIVAPRRDVRAPRFAKVRRPAAPPKPKAPTRRPRDRSFPGVPERLRPRRKPISTGGNP